MIYIVHFDNEPSCQKSGGGHQGGKHWQLPGRKKSPHRYHDNVVPTTSLLSWRIIIPTNPETLEPQHHITQLQNAEAQALRPERVRKSGQRQLPQNVHESRPSHK